MSTANPKSAEEYFSDGISFFEQEKYQKAVVTFSKVIKIDPTYKDVYYWRGCCYMKIGQGEKVKKSVKTTTSAPPKPIQVQPKITANTISLSPNAVANPKVTAQKPKLKAKSGGFIKSNVAYLIWVIVYIFIVWTILGQSQEAFIFTVVAYAVSIAIALSPVGEWVLCFLNGTRKIKTSQDKDYLEPIFEEVYEQVRARTPSVSDNIQLRIINAMYLNAFAMGKHTIAVTRGAMQTLSADELKGVLAHEFAHIVNGDTKALLIKVVGNMLFSLIILFVKAILWCFQVMLKIFTKNQAIDFFIGGLRFCLDVVVIIFMFVGDIILSINSRKSEYLADDYASMIGYNSELTQALYLFQKTDMGGSIKLLDRIKSSHPNIEKRIVRLEKWQDEQDNII